MNVDDKTVPKYPANAQESRPIEADDAGLKRYLASTTTTRRTKG